MAAGSVIERRGVRTAMRWARAARSRTSPRSPGVATLVCYSVFGSILCWSRLTGLNRSYWRDETFTVTTYVRGGPDEILFGTYIPNNHELFSLLAWATTSFLGDSEVAVRVWSVLPFILGVAVVSAWLHVRMGLLTAVLYMFFVTVSPLLLDLSRQARGYGLAFLAMSVVVVAALEADRTHRSWAIATFAAAGVVGTWTLPIFAIAFLATGIVLLVDASTRRRTALGLLGSMLAIALWYAPHIDGLLESSGQPHGERISRAGILIAPFEHLLVPLFIGGIPDFVPLSGGIEGWGSGETLETLVITASSLLLFASSPLLRGPKTASILCVGIVSTLLVIWLARLFLVPRFVSFLAVPLLILLSSGIGRIASGFGKRRPGVRDVIALTAVVLVTVVSTLAGAKITRLPREAHKDVAALIRERAASGTPIFAYMLHPDDLAFYLDRPLRAPDASVVASRVCRSRGVVVLVTQPYMVEPVRIPCLLRRGVDHVRLRQYTRGGEMNVWFIPPRDCMHPPC